MTQSELAPLLRSDGQGIFLSCHVQPRAVRSAIIGLYGKAVKVALAAPPVDGKANAELCKFLAKHLDVSKSTVHLAAGQTSRDKIVRIDGIAVAEILEKLCE